MITTAPQSQLLTELISILNARPGWTTWADLRIAAQQSGHHVAGWDRRSVAAAAEESAGAILSCTDGYKLAARATEPEILMAYRQTLRKAIATDRRARAIIANARRRGLLRDHNDEQTRRDVERELEMAITPSHRPAPIHPQPTPSTQQPTPVRVEQIELL